MDYRESAILRLNDPPDMSFRPEIPIKVKRLTSADIDQIMTFYGDPEDSPRYRSVVECFKRNADCIIGIHEGNAVAISWGYRDRDCRRELGAIPGPEEDAVVVGDIETSILFREKGVATYVLSRQLDDYHRRGIRVMAELPRANKALSRVLAHLGFKRVSTTRELRLLGAKLF